MTVIQAIILGIVQGVTEFIPVSSSAHLVLVPWLFGWEIPPVSFDVMLHMGTLVAVTAYFWRDWLDVARDVLSGLARRDGQHAGIKLLLMLIVATIPAAVIGVLIKSQVEAVFQNPQAVAWLLLGTAAILLASEHLGRQERMLEDMTWFDSLIIGLTQAVAILPGISRSGSTIGAGLGRHFKRDDAARFSFLMSTPIILGAGLVGVKDILREGLGSTDLAPLIAGFLSALIVGYLAIWWLLGFLKKRPLAVFSVYCMLLSALSLAVIALGVRKP